MHLRLPFTGPGSGPASASTSASSLDSDSDSDSNDSESPNTVAAARARAAHVRTNVSEYAGLLGQACPAAVYEYVDVEPGSVEGEEAGGGWGGKKLVINSQVSVFFFSFFLSFLFLFGGQRCVPLYWFADC